MSETIGEVPEVPKRPRKILIAVLVVVIVGVAAVSVFILYSYIDSGVDDEIFETFSQVCEGQGVNEAAAYTGSGPHPIVLLNWSGNKHPWTNSIPKDWRPKSVEDVELVVFVGGEEEKVIEICKYTGPDITRYQYYLDVQLREAKTGKIVAETTLYGSMPRECRQTESYSLTELYGDRVSFDQLEEWLDRYVATNY